MEQLILRIREQTEIPVTRKDMESILAALLVTEDAWECVGLSSQPFLVVTETLKELRIRKYIEVNKSKVFLTPEGKKFCQAYNIKPKTNNKCPCCQGKGISIDKFGDLYNEFCRITRNRPEPLLEFDQAFIKPEGVIAKIALMEDRGDLSGKDIVVLGDDDFFGIAAALSGRPNKVAVLEIDWRIVNFFKQTRQRENLNLEIIQHDLREPIPEDLLGKFDVFVTEPPDTLGGLKLFIARGLACLKGPGGTGYFGITLIESSLQKWLALQQMLSCEFGLVIREIMADFSPYSNWDYLLESIPEEAKIEPFESFPSCAWYRSSLFRVEAMEGFKFSNLPASQEEIYLDEENLILSYRDKGA